MTVEIGLHGNRFCVHAYWEELDGVFRQEKVKLETQINMPTFQCSASAQPSLVRKQHENRLCFYIPVHYWWDLSQQENAVRTASEFRQKNHVSSYFRRTGSAISPSEKWGGFPLVRVIERTCFHLKDVVNIWQSEEGLELCRNLGRDQEPEA